MRASDQYLTEDGEKLARSTGELKYDPEKSFEEIFDEWLLLNIDKLKPSAETTAWIDQHCRSYLRSIDKIDFSYPEYIVNNYPSDTLEKFESLNHLVGVDLKILAHSSDLSDQISSAKACCNEGIIPDELLTEIGENYNR